MLSLKHDLHFNQLSIVIALVHAVGFTLSDNVLDIAFAKLSIESRSKAVTQSLKDGSEVIIRFFQEEYSIRQSGLGKAGLGFWGEASDGSRVELGDNRRDKPGDSERDRLGGSGKGGLCGDGGGRPDGSGGDKAGDRNRGKIDTSERRSILGLIWIPALVSSLIVSSQLGTARFLTYN